MKCCLCNQYIPNMARTFPIVNDIRSYVLCEDCNAYLEWMRDSERKEDLDAAFAFFKPIFDNKEILLCFKVENQYSWPYIVRCWVDLMHMHISEMNIPYQLTFLWIHGFKSTLSVIKHYINMYCIRTCHNVIYKLFLIPINKHMKNNFLFHI